DLKRALQWSTRLNERARVIFGMNLKESTQCAACLGLKLPADPKAGILDIARSVREKLGIYAAVVHPREGAAAAVEVDGRVETAQFMGPFTHKPKLSTGAGDNFNAGFCVGTL